MNRRIFVDMDGTLAKWNNVATEVLYEKGYYRNLEPNQILVDEVKRLINNGEDVYVLSSFLSDSEYALSEKNLWLDEYLPEIPKDKRIFVHYGDNKNDYITNGITISDYLIDDYTKNLLSWKQAGGTGIKFLNGINHTKGTWDGFKIKNNKDITEKIQFILDNNRDNKKFNEQYLELRSTFLDAINRYRMSIDKPLEQFLNTEIEMKSVKTMFLHERKKIFSFFKIEEKSRWLDEGDMFIHYQINFKNGQILYEGYTYLNLCPEPLTTDEIINHILNIDLADKIDITKVSPELKSFIDNILSTDHEGNVRLKESDLLSSWDVGRYELADKIKDVERELNDLGISSTVDIFYTRDGCVSYIDIKPTIILEFDFSREYQKQIKKESCTKEDFDMEMEYE